MKPFTGVGKSEVILNLVAKNVKLLMLTSCLPDEPRQVTRATL